METLPFEGLLRRLGCVSHDEKMSQETWCSKDYWPGEELDSVIESMEVRTSTRGNGNRLGSE